MDKSIEKIMSNADKYDHLLAGQYTTLLKNDVLENVKSLLKGYSFGVEVVVLEKSVIWACSECGAALPEDGCTSKVWNNGDYNAVSYTHLTLPTILLVQISVVAVSLKKKKLTHI
eukprot:TRINITY_DN27810_c0_g1_i3.p2 TRINITY_DN27810_c0_g1~~TRINITY_DN27810_c0_g1_i3.p2  ORF type:complete len:115 (+),score=28.82 TRINITY_DN27810_c0_g1_i3:325-669(+)